MLHVAEIASDVQWSLTNLWHTGITDSLRTTVPIIVPRTPDVLRGEALEAYGSATVPVGMLGSADDGLWLGIAPSRALPVLDAGAIGEPTRRTLLRAIARRQRDAKTVGGRARPVVLRCRVTNEDDIERLVAVLSAAAEATAKPSWSIGPLDLDAAHGPTPDLIAVEMPDLAPAVASAAMNLRRRRASKINTRRILEHFAAATVPEPPPAPPRSPKRGEREFIASMMGQTSIPGSTMSAHFVGGVLCGIHGTEIETGTLKPASNWILTADGRRVEAAMSSCFSFESEISRGLRSECSIVDPETGASARIRTEYSFVGEYDALVATQHSFVEGGDPDDTLMVLGIPILEPGPVRDYQPLPRRVDLRLRRLVETAGGRARGRGLRNLGRRVGLHFRPADGRGSPHAVDRDADQPVRAADRRRRGAIHSARRPSITCRFS